MSINIIWDFDGVIADSELVWLENRRKLLNEQLNLNWDMTTIYKHIGGMSDMGKKLKLQEMGINVPESFWQEVLKMDTKSIINGEMIVTPNVEKVFEAFVGHQCVATGGIFSKTKEKLENIGFKNFFADETLFTADMVGYGKPEPDIFLLAQETMGWDKKDCVVIEDSIPGMIAGKRADIKTIAFTGNYSGNKEAFIKEIQKIGIEHVFDDMLDIKEFLTSI
ncbi:MAG: HAD family phosphatase [Alphaproteobacteria bacterium]